ncbi:MAG: hypothetical protein R3345_00540 [Fulvivirga sp.]|nr:hypothetical protein [Fulvivirga sp.]
MKRFISHIWMFLVIVSCTSEIDSERGEADVFTKFYGTINQDEAANLTASPDGGFVIVGTNEIELAEETLTKIHAIKIDGDGNVIWDRLFPDFENDVNTEGERINYAGAAIAPTDNGYIIVGDSIYNEENADLLVLAITENGEVVAVNTLAHGAGDLHGQAVAQTSTGNYVVLAGIENNSEPENMLVAQFDNSLQVMWQQEYGIGDQGAISKSIYVAENEITWAGTTVRSQNEEDVRMISTPPNSKNAYFDETVGLGSGHNERGADIVKTPTGYAICGTTDDTMGGDNDIFLISLNNDGQIIWTQTFGGPGEEEGHALIYAADNTLIVLGSTDSYGNGERDMLLVKTDLAGNVIWSAENELEAKTFGGLNDEFGATIKETADGHLLVLGMADFGDIGTMILLKIRKDGTLEQ